MNYETEIVRCLCVAQEERKNAAQVRRYAEMTAGIHDANADRLERSAANMQAALTASRDAREAK